ncbi:MAG: hypothetical protein EBZ13_00265 [Planctomycetia bacterium]|nr:hypothetical protein [Planctomycetia bacterium]
MAVGVERTTVAILRRIPAVNELNIKPKPLRADIEGRQIEGLQLVPPADGIEVRQVHRGRDIQGNRPRFSQLNHFAEPAPPVRVIKRCPVTVDVPAGKSVLPVDAVHVAVGGRIIRRHWREDLVVGVVEAAAFVGADVVVDWQLPAGVATLLLQEHVDLAIGLKVIAAARTAADRCQQQPNDNMPP